jgi:hypothetical protein
MCCQLKASGYALSNCIGIVIAVGLRFQSFVVSCLGQYKSSVCHMDREGIEIGGCTRTYMCKIHATLVEVIILFLTLIFFCCVIKDSFKMPCQLKASGKHVILL